MVESNKSQYAAGRLNGNSADDSSQDNVTRVSPKSESQGVFVSVQNMFLHHCAIVLFYCTFKCEL